MKISFKIFSSWLCAAAALGFFFGNMGFSRGESPWGPDDEAGNSNTQSYLTYLRAGLQMVRPGAKAYRLAHLFSERMSQEFLSTPWSQEAKETEFLPFLLHAANGEIISGQITGQGTQMDALGHFGYKTSLENEEVFYYNGFTQDEVKGPEGLLKLGIEKSKPIVTTAVLLDARKHLNNGAPMTAGQLITAEDIEFMLDRQNLRPLLPGDVLLVYTGWSELWLEDDPNPLGNPYFQGSPGLTYDAALYLAGKKIAVIGMDTQYIDAVNEGFFQGQAPPPPGSLPGLPASVHHHSLTQAGIFLVENMKLKELADDKVYLSAIFISPLPIRGGSGSPVAPIAVGAPWRF